MSFVHRGWQIDDDVDVVMTAGDFANGVLGIRWAREPFTTKEIIYVAGNHELYEYRRRPQKAWV